MSFYKWRKLSPEKWSHGSRLCPAAGAGSVCSPDAGKFLGQSARRVRSGGSSRQGTGLEAGQCAGDSLAFDDTTSGDKVSP